MNLNLPRTLLIHHKIHAKFITDYVWLCFLYPAIFWLLEKACFANQGYSVHGSYVATSIALLFLHWRGSRRDQFSHSAQHTQGTSRDIWDNLHLHYSGPPLHPMALKKFKCCNSTLSKVFKGKKANKKISPTTTCLLPQDSILLLIFIIQSWKAPLPQALRAFPM